MKSVELESRLAKRLFSKIFFLRDRYTYLKRFVHILNFSQVFMLKKYSFRDKHTFCIQEKIRTHKSTLQGQFVSEKLFIPGGFAQID